MKKVIGFIIITLIVILSVSFVFKDEKTLVSSGSENNKETEDDIKEEVEVEIDNSVKISVAGDIMYHQSQLDAAYDVETDTYDFEGSYKYLDKYIKDADLSLVTIETTFGGKEFGYAGYPNFATPAVALDSLKSAGFDMISLASNHVADKPIKAYYNTISEVRDRGFDVLGVRENEDIPSYTVKEVNGMKIGFTNYTFETSRIGGHKHINSIKVPGEISNLINSFSTERLNEDLEGMNKVVQEMKADGAEFIIFVMHWGEEYQTMYSNTQKKIAEALNSYGVDIIFGSHSHVVQPIETIINKDTNKETLVFYALGNFISNQRKETMGNEKSEDGSIAQIVLDRNEDATVYLKSYEYIPTWVYKYTDKNNKLQYTVLPIEETLKNYDSSTGLLPQHIIDALKVSQTSTTEIIGQP